MSSIVDVTEQVSFEWNDDECLPLTKCVCGATWQAWAGPILGIEKDWADACPECGRKLYFGISIRVYEVVE